MAHQEIHFFDKDYNYSKGMEWYSQFFAQASGRVIVAEKTPEYLWANGRGGEGIHSHSGDVHHRIKSHFPNARFIVVLRDPVRRALSAFNHARSNGYFSPEDTADSIMFGDKREMGSAFGILEKGIYADMLKPYFELFDRSRFLILGFEQGVCGKPRETLDMVCEFLGLSSFQFAGLDKPENQVRASLVGMWLRYRCPRLRQVARYLDRCLPACRMHTSETLVSELKDFYRPHNERLANLLDTSFGPWT